MVQVTLSSLKKQIMHIVTPITLYYAEKFWDPPIQIMPFNFWLNKVLSKQTPKEITSKQNYSRIQKLNEIANHHILYTAYIS